MLNLNTNHHRKGEALIETVIAMSILAIGITIAGQIMSTSLRNVNSSKNRVIAVNIAKEGLEAIRNIRDTNWLRYSGKKRECWNHEPAQDNIDPCPDLINGSDYKPILPGRYIIYKQPIDEADISLGWKWRLESLTEGKTQEAVMPTNGSPSEFFIIENGKTVSYIWNGNEYMDLTQLYIVDIDPLTNSDDDTALDQDRYKNDRDTFNHALINENEGTALGKDLAIKTPFRREISIEYLNDNGDVALDPTANRMLVRSKVTWQESKNTFSTELATHLTDYLGRVRLD